MNAEPTKTSVAIWDWMGTQLLLAIPGVNIILLIIWAITGRHRSKRNYAIAALIWIGILLVLGTLAILFFGPQISAWLAKLDQTLFQPN